MTPHRILTTTLFGVLVALLAMPFAVDAQTQEGRWSVPIRLSTNEGAVIDSKIISDRFGFAHVFWVENLFEDSSSLIYYARFDGNAWTAPVDIYRPSSFVDHLAADIDQGGTIHLVWTEGGGFRAKPAYYMKAPAQGAGSARNWSPRLSIGIQAYQVNLLVDSQDNLHLLFSRFYGADIGVYYIRSVDGGDSWSEPLWLDPDIPPGYSPDSLKVAIDEMDGLHAVWSYTTTDLWQINWILYVHSLDSGSSWITPVTIDKDDANTGRLRAADPLITTQGERVHLIWGDDITSGYPRKHRMSLDRGRTLEPAVPVFANLEGQAFDGLAVDSASRVHYFGQLRWPQGVYHAVFQDEQWSLPGLIYLIRFSSVDTISEDIIHAHHLRPAVLNGNQLVLLLHDPSGDPTRQLYVMTHTLTDTPAENVVPLPSPIPSPSPTSVQTRAVASPTPIPPIQPGAGTARVNSRSESTPLWIGAGSGIFLVGIVVLVRFLKGVR